MERGARDEDANLLRNQPYDESVEVTDPEEVRSEYSPNPRSLRQSESRSRSRRGRSLMSAHSGTDHPDDDLKAPRANDGAPGPPGASPHEEEEEEDDSEEEEDDSDDDDDDDDEPSGAPEGAYDPADYANLPVSSEIKELFQYITRYKPQNMELEHSLKPFIPDFIPAVGDIDAFLKVPRPDGKDDNLGLLVLDEPSVKQSEPTVLSLWLSEESKQHGAQEVSSPIICREPLHVMEVNRYTRDQGSSVYFPQAVLMGDDLYDLTLTDGDCRLRVTLDPGLNRLVDRNVLRPGSTLRNVTFIPAMAAQLPECPGACGEKDSFRLVKVEVADGVGSEEGGVRPVHVGGDSLPWFGRTEDEVDPTDPLLPLRANRSVFLPLWNIVDYSGKAWREAPPTDEERDEEEEEHRSSVTVSELRDAYLSGLRRGTVKQQLIVRITNKSQLMYYGKPDRNCECPYKAVLEVWDRTGSVCVVMWNSVCLTWYRCLKPGDIISLRHFRVKQRYQADPDEIEISVNSRNPAARIAILPESSVSLECVPPPPSYSFCNSEELSDRLHGDVCDVIGLLTFAGRSERIRSKDGRWAELEEYRWLRLEDGASEQPIMLKLYSTSQPESHLQLHPLSVVVCTRLKVIRPANRTDSAPFLTNTLNTQVYCTGQGHHSEMSYRKLRPVRRFLQWLKSQDDGQVLSRALIGGSFIYPPPSVSLESYMKEQRGELGFLRGAELQRELERLSYRERRTFCVQAAVTMVTYSRRGEEDRCLFWSDRPSSLPTSPSLSSSSSPSLLPLLSFRPPLSSSSSFCPTSPSSSISQLTPRPLDVRIRKATKRRLLQTDTPKKRPSVTLQPEPKNRTVILFEASMEFLENTNTDEGEEDEDEHEDAASYATAPLPPSFPPVAVETLPMLYQHGRREEQAVAVSMDGSVTAEGFDFAVRDHFTLRLKALSDGVMVDAIFLPNSSSSLLSPSLHHHSNTWSSILSHGAFSSHAPPPSPADLIAMAAQLANQRLVCVLEACHLGGAKTELLLSRAFHLTA